MAFGVLVFWLTWWTCPLFGVLVDLVDMTTGGRVVVGGRVLVVSSREQEAVEEHARRAGAGIGRPANQSCASRPPLSSPVHLCPISPPALTPLASPWSCRAPAPPPCPAGMHLWPSEAAVWVVQLLSGRAVFHE